MVKEKLAVVRTKIDLKISMQRHLSLIHVQQLCQAMEHSAGN